MRHSLILLPCLLIACSTNLEISPDTRVQCASTAECPEGYRCATTIQQCVPADGNDETLPTLVGGAAIEPAIGTALTTFTVTLTVSEPLIGPPVVVATHPGGFAVDFLPVGDFSGAETEFRLQYVARGAGVETEGSYSVIVTLIDKSGNEQTEPAGTFDLDFTAPTGTAAWVGLADRSVVQSTELLAFEMRTQTDVAEVVATLVDVDGNLVATLAPSLATGAELVASGTVDPTSLSGLPEAVRVVFDLTDAAGNAAPTAAQTATLRIDDEPPVLVSFSTTSPVTAVLQIPVELQALDAAEMYLSGDVLDDATTLDWVPFAELSQVTLTAGDGPKVVEARVRDAALNESQTLTFIVDLASGPVESSPTLAAPPGQTAAKDSDTLTIGGQAEPLATLVRASLVRALDGVLVQDATAAVVIDPDGSIRGELLTIGLTHNESVAIEVIVAARGAESVPANSRSLPVAVDLLPPGPPAAANIRINEVAATPEAVETTDSAFNSFALTGLANAAPAAAGVRVYAGASLATLLGEQSVAGDGSFAAVTLPFTPTQSFFVTARDGAGNESSAVELGVPRATGLVVIPKPARQGLQVDGLPVRIVFTTNGRLAANPGVTVAGRAAQYQAGDRNLGSGDTYLYHYTPDGSEAEGVASTVARITMEPDPGLAAAGSSGTDATTTGFDFTAPAAAAGSVAVAHNPPGTDDTVSGTAGTVSDSAAATPLNLGTFPVSLEVLDGASVLGSTTANADGSFAAIAMGDNAVDSFELRLTDAAGNSTTVGPFLADREAPNLSNLVATPPFQRSGEALTITFEVSDNLLDLIALPVVTVGGRGATWVAGTASTADGQPHAFEYTYPVSGGIDVAGDNDILVDFADAAGNADGATTQVFFDFDVPVSANVAPGGVPVWNGAPAILGTAADVGAGLVRVEVALYEVDTATWWDGAAFSSSAQPLWRTAVGLESWSHDEVSATELTDTYDYQLYHRAVDQALNTEVEQRVDFQFVENALAVPINLQAHSIGDGRIRVSWDAPAGTLDGYNLYYAATDTTYPPYSGTGASQGDSPINLVATSMTLEDLAADTYAFAVTALHNGQGESPFSLTVEASANTWHWQQPALTGNVARDVISPVAGVFVAVGQAGTIWRSVDDGATWVTLASPAGLADLQVVANRGAVVIAAGDAGTIIRSSDAGATWTQVASPANVYFGSLVSDSAGACPGAGNCTLFATYGGGGSASGARQVVRSHDGGQSWEIRSPTFSVQPESLHYDGAVVMTGDSGSVIHYSTDDGEAWTTEDLGTGNIYLTALGTNGSRWLACGHRNPQQPTCYRTDNGGVLWLESPVGGGINWSDNIYEIMHVSGTTWVGAVGGGHDGVMYSTDNGSSWGRFDTDPVPIFGFARTAGILFARALEVTTEKIWHSTDDGATWSELASGVGGNAIAFNGTTGVAVGPLRRSSEVQIARSTDSGTTWSKPVEYNDKLLAAVGIEGGTAIAVGGASDYYFASNEVLRSTDYGLTWAEISLPASMEANLIHGRGGTWVASLALRFTSTAVRSVWASRDDGLTWVEHSALTGNDYNEIHADGGVWMLAGGAGAVARSLDDGASWSAEVLSGVTWDFEGIWGAEPHWVVAGREAILETCDNGETWTPVTLPVGSERYRDVTGSGSTVVVVGEDGEMMVTTDLSCSGTTPTSTWAEPTNTATSRDLNTVFTPDGGNWVALASSRDVFITTDPSGTWTVVANITTETLGSLAGNAQYLVTWDGANDVFFSRDYGASWWKSDRYEGPGQAALYFSPDLIRAIAVADNGRAISVGPLGGIMTLSPE